jgi:hypothetical protein
MPIGRLESPVAKTAGLFLATTINAERAEPAEKAGFVLRALRFLR